MEPLHLRNAPIREAVLDLRIREGTPPDLQLLRRVLQEAGVEDIKVLRRGSFTITFSGLGSPSGEVDEGEPVGVRGTSADGLHVVQLRGDGMTFSRLPPYEDWRAFRSAARPFVERFLSAVEPASVDRAGLRYINHFKLPYPSKVEEYFRAVPPIPEELPQHVSNLLLRLTIHDPGRDFSAHVTQALLDELDPQRWGFILDIDAFRAGMLPAALNELWETLEELRVFKNRVFFGLITDRAKEQCR